MQVNSGGIRSVGVVVFGERGGIQRWIYLIEESRGQFVIQRVLLRFFVVLGVRLINRKIQVIEIMIDLEGFRGVLELEFQRAEVLEFVFSCFRGDFVYFVLRWGVWFWGRSVERVVRVQCGMERRWQFKQSFGGLGGFFGGRSI